MSLARAVCAMNLIDTYQIKLYGPDAELSPDQEDALNQDRERFDADLRKLVDAAKDSALSVTISSW